MISACTKPKFENAACTENCYILEGIVLDTPYNKPVAGAEINMRYWGESSWNKWVASAKTDQDGYWKMSVDADYFENASEEVQLKFNATSYLDISESFTLDSTLIDIPQQVNMRLFKETRLGIWIRKSPNKEFTKFHVQSKYDYTLYSFTVNASGPLDTIIYIRTAADVITKVTGYTSGGDYYLEAYSIAAPAGTPAVISFLVE